MQFLNVIEILQNIPKKLPIIWASFARNSVAKNFPKSPNLVTLSDDEQHLMSKSIQNNRFWQLLIKVSPRLGPTKQFSIICLSKNTINEKTEESLFSSPATFSASPTKCNYNSDLFNSFISLPCFTWNKYCFTYGWHLLNYLHYVARAIVVRMSLPLALKSLYYSYNFLCNTYQI